MRWDNKFILYFLIFLPFIALFIFYFDRKRNLIINKFISVEEIINLSFRKRILKNIIYILGVFFLLISLASPRWGKVWQKQIIKTKQVLFIIDTSKSMMVEDLKPSRIELAKQKVKFLIENLNASAGIVFFAGTSFLSCPITFDKEATKMFLNENWENMIGLPGSNIEDAIKTSISSINELGGKTYFILITDGEELQGNYQKEISKLKEKNITLISYGFGTEEGGPIPEYSNGNLKDYKKDQKGNVVISKLNIKLLLDLSEKTDGIFVKATEDFSDCARIINFIEKGKEGKMKEKRSFTLEVRYQYFLLIAIILFMLEFMIIERKK